LTQEQLSVALRVVPAGQVTGPHGAKVKLGALQLLDSAKDAKKKLGGLVTTTEIQLVSQVLFSTKNVTELGPLLKEFLEEL